jgi:hypothetical protein
MASQTLSEILKSNAAAHAAVANVPVMQDAVQESNVPGSIDTSKRVYKSAAASMQMCSEAGARIIFVNHRFITDDPEVIDYLDKQVNKYKVPGLFIDKGEMFYDANIHDPIAALRNQLRKELMEEMQLRTKAASGNPNRDLGSYDQGKLVPASTTTIAPVAAGAGPTS